ncbi:MAG: dinitrogenase iron-molybdenum cofactor biosynthesis protein, partial [Gammaproteobacteria bacterium]
MKTVITSKGNNQKSLFDLRFGRAGWFCLIDNETGATSFIENDQAEATGGAGTKAAEKMVELGVQEDKAGLIRSDI